MPLSIHANIVVACVLTWGWPCVSTPKRYLYNVTTNPWFPSLYELRFWTRRQGVCYLHKCYWIKLNMFCFLTRTKIHIHRIWRKKKSVEMLLKTKHWGGIGAGIQWWNPTIIWTSNDYTTSMNVKESQDKRRGGYFWFGRNISTRKSNCFFWIYYMESYCGINFVYFLLMA